MALSANPELLVKGFIRDARDEAEPIAWVRGIQKTAMAAVRAGDEYASSVSHAGSSTGWVRDVSASVLVSICEAALQVLEAEAAAVTAGLPGGPTGRVSYGDFSGVPAVMG